VRDVIAKYVAEGRAPDETAFLEEAVMRYAMDLEEVDDDAEVLAAADKGIAEIKAGRFETFSGPEGDAQFGESLSRQLQELIGRQRG
jgi:hypothetical protein